MSDKVAIPRSFAGAIGVADVNDSIKRTHAMKLLQVTNSTTGQFLGNSTTAPTLFARNVTIEKVICSFWLQSTATTGTTLFAFNIYDGASTVFSSKKLNSTTQLSTTGWYSKAGATLGALSKVNLTSASKVWLHITSNSPTAQVKKANIWIRFKERADS